MGVNLHKDVTMTLQQTNKTTASLKITLLLPMHRAH